MLGGMCASTKHMSEYQIFIILVNKYSELQQNTTSQVEFFSGLPEEIYFRYQKHTFFISLRSVRSVVTYIYRYA